MRTPADIPIEELVAFFRANEALFPEASICQKRGYGFDDRWYKQLEKNNHLARSTTLSWLLKLQERHQIFFPDMVPITQADVDHFFGLFLSNNPRPSLQTLANSSDEDAAVINLT